MNKKLIAVAIAAAVAAPGAMAGTTLYGKIHMSINDATNAWAVDDHSNRIGFKGSEDLGNGLKAIFQYEMGYNGADDVTDTGSSHIFTGRNSYIGLAGDFGQIRVGRHDTPAKVAFYAAGNERLGDSIIDLNGAFGFDELRTTDAIAYISPNFSGFTVAGAVVPGETAGGADGIADGYSLGAMYSGGGLKAGVGYTDVEDITAGTTDSNLLNIGASYTMDAFSLGAQWQNVENGGVEKDSWAITGAAGFGNNTLILMYGNSEIDGGIDDDTFGVAVSHSMSKRTSAYVAYRNSDIGGVSKTWIGNGGTTSGDAFGVGMIHNF